MSVSNEMLHISETDSQRSCHRSNCIQKTISGFQASSTINIISTQNIHKYPHLQGDHPQGSIVNFLLGRGFEKAYHVQPLQLHVL